MGLDATTFALEIVNFLVLLWLLYRFLFRPMQAAIAKRQQQDEAARKALEAQRHELEARQAEVAQVSAGLDAERQAAHQKLASEMAEERSRRLRQLETEVENERARAKARVEAGQAHEARVRDALAGRRARDFVRRYLERLAGPALEQAIIGLFLSDLAALDAPTRNRLAEASAAGSIEVTTAFEAQSPLRDKVETALRELLGRAVPVQWRTDSGVIAGISVRLDGHQLDANLSRGIDAFPIDADIPA